MRKGLLFCLLVLSFCLPVQAAPTLRGASSAQAAFQKDASDVLTLPAPPATSAGDLLFACTLVVDGRAFRDTRWNALPPAGWTWLAGTALGYQRADVWGKLATDTEPAAYSWSYTTAAGKPARSLLGAGMVLSYSGVDRARALWGVSAARSDLNGASFDAGAVVGAPEGAYALYFLAEPFESGSWRSGGPVKISVPGRCRVTAAWRPSQSDAPPASVVRHLAGGIAASAFCLVLKSP